MIEVAILLSCISLNSLTPFVKAEKSENTAVLIMIENIKPINKYIPEYWMILLIEISFSPEMDKRIIFVIEGMISLSIIPVESIIPPVKIANAMLSSFKDMFLKNIFCNILKEMYRIKTDMTMAIVISIKASVNSLVFIMIKCW